MERKKNILFNSVKLIIASTMVYVLLYYENSFLSSWNTPFYIFNLPVFGAMIVINIWFIHKYLKSFLGSWVVVIYLFILVCIAYIFYLDRAHFI